MRLVLILMPCLAFGQVNVSLSMASSADCQSLFSKSVCNKVSFWVGTIENDTPDPVAIGPSAVIRKIPQLRPLTPQVAQIIAQQGQNRNWMTISLQVLGGMATGAAAIVSGQVKASGEIAKLLTSARVAYYLNSFLLVEPYAASFLKGNQPPIMANFNSLAWTQPLQLMPGASATFHLFTSEWAKPQEPYTFQIDVSKVTPVRLAQ